MSKIYDNLISTAVKSIEIVDNDVKVIYNSDINKEYTFKCENILEFENNLCQELLGIELKNESSSVGRFLHNNIKAGILIENK